MDRHHAGGRRAPSSDRRRDNSSSRPYAAAHTPIMQTHRRAAVASTTALGKQTVTHRQEALCWRCALACAVRAGMVRALLWSADGSDVQVSEELAATGGTSGPRQRPLLNRRHQHLARCVLDAEDAYQRGDLQTAMVSTTLCYVDDVRTVLYLGGRRPSECQWHEQHASHQQRSGRRQTCARCTAVRREVSTYHSDTRVRRPPDSPSTPRPAHVACVGDSGTEGGRGIASALSRVGRRGSGNCRLASGDGERPGAKVDTAADLAGGRLTERANSRWRDPREQSTQIDSVLGHRGEMEARAGGRA